LTEQSNKPNSFEPFLLDSSLNDIEAALTVRPARRTRLLVKIIRSTMLLGLVLSAGLAVFSWLWLNELGLFSVSDSQLDLIVNRKPDDNSLVYDRDGNKIGEYFNTYNIYIPYEKIPKDMINAIVAIEDRSFWTHQGFDPRGIVRAAIAKVKGHSLQQGASTITQQVVRHFLLPKEKSIQRKLQEISLAWHLEKKLPKEKIIEIYANTMFLGNGSYGIGAAAYRYFGKSIDQLKTQEFALIAGLFQSPSRYNPSRHPKRAKQRQTLVLKSMYAAGMLNFPRTQKLIKATLAYEEYKPINTATSPYFIDYVKEQAMNLLREKGRSVDGQGLRIYTTLDTKMQKLAEQSIEESAELLNQAQSRVAQIRDKKGKVRQATLETAILSVDPRSGEILSMVGGRDYSKTKYNRTYQAMRSPGSAFKPIVFSLALEKKMRWSDVIYVSPVSINNYRPHTPDEDFLTETTLMRAFYRSMNTPTIEVGQRLGLGPVIEHAKKLGIRSPIKEEFGSMLGSSDVTMMDMARVYSAFANEGNLVDQIAIRKIVDRSGKIIYKAPTVAERTTRVMTPQIAYLMTQGMRAVLAMGTGYTSARLAGVAAGKTGTSNDSADNWFCGYTGNHVAITWVGTDEHAKIHGDVTGGKLALPIWDRYITKTFDVRKPGGFRAPSGLVTTFIHPKFGNRSPNGVRMYFLRGNEPPQDSSALEVLSQSQEGNYRNIFAH
jgi:penicillin-binding protein 1A